MDTWTVSELCGTGSHDFTVSDLFVPGDRSVSFITDRSCQPGPTYAFPIFGLLAVGVTSVALGMARGAIDTLVELARTKVPTGSRRRLSERSSIQTQVAQAEALLRSARSFLFATVGEAGKTAAAGEEISLKQRAVLRLAANHATTSSAQAIDLMYHAAGTSSIYASSPLQRYFRDIHVLTQHAVTGPPIYEMTGRLFLGLDTDTGML